VTTSRLGEIAGVRAVPPPRWLVRLAGDVAARCIVLFWLAARDKPDIVGGFHLLVNALAAQVAARWTGARSLYFCVAGADEAAGGGFRAENPVFGRMQTPDRFVETGLLRAVAAFDLLITMGTGAAGYFRARGFRGACHVVAGGVDGDSCGLGSETPPADIVVVGRLVPIKRLDVFVEAMALVRHRLPGVTATLVGDGPERRRLGDAARRLGVDDRLRFAGFHRDVRPWLATARLCVLSSDSEGLPLALVEAMMSGLPVVATDVGDVGDLVEDGVSGFLVPRRDPQRLADRIVEALGNEARRSELGRRAREAALRYETRQVTAAWEGILARYDPGAGGSAAPS
jgi:glycosyltransferase involved in cell wall biosynthesis